MKLTVGAKIWACLGAILVILIIVGLVSYRSTLKLMDTADLVDHTHSVIGALTDLRSTLDDAETGARGYVVTGEDPYLAPYTDALRRLDHNIEALKDLTADNPVQQRNIEQIRPLIAEKLAALKEAVDARRDKGFEPARQLVVAGAGKTAMDNFRRLAGEMEAVERQLLAQRAAEAKASSDMAAMITVAGMLFACVFVAASGWYLTQSIARPLKEGVNVLAAAAGEIVTITTQVASGSAETMAALTETSSTMEEVKKTAQVASDKARYVSETAQKTVEVSESGRRAVEQSIAGVSRVREQMEEVAETIVRLSEQSQAIGEIVATVNDLSEQSNLLAVNAAIEAAKAGEQGRGFAVVAQEVRSLAEQSKQATTQVRTVLGEMQKATSAAVLAVEQGSKAVEAGVQQSREAGETIQQLARSIAEAAQAATQIAASSQQQQVGMDQVALAMENIRQASAQNASGTKQAEGAAHNLNELGLKLKLMVGT